MNGPWFCKGFWVTLCGVLCGGCGCYGYHVRHLGDRTARRSAQEIPSSSWLALPSAAATPHGYHLMLHSWVLEGVHRSPSACCGSLQAALCLQKAGLSMPFRVQHRDLMPVLQMPALACRVL